MGTIASRGNSVVSTSGSTWANTANAIDGAVGTTPATYATFTNAASGGVGTIVIGGYFGTGSLSTGQTPTAISALIRHSEGTSSRWTSVTAQLQDSTGTAIGTAQTVALSNAATSTTITPSVVPTFAQINAGLRMLITATHSGTTSAVFSLDYCDITITFTPVNTTISPTGASLTLTGGTPAIIAGTRINPAGASLVLTGGTPYVMAPILPAAATLALTGGTPSINPMYPALRDTFDTLATAKWNKYTFGTAIKTVGGKLQITPATNTDTYVDTTNGPLYDFTGSQAWAEVAWPTGYDGQTSAFIGMYIQNLSGSAGIEIMIRTDITPGTTTLQAYLAGAIIGTPITYDPIAHRFLRMRELSGVFYFDTSPEGISWTNRWSTTSTALSAAVTQLLCGFEALSSEATPSTAVIDNLNVETPYADYITDPFTTKDTVKWTWGGTPASVVSGQLQLVPKTTYNGNIISNQHFRLVFSSVVVQAVQVPNAGVSNVVGSYLVAKSVHNSAGTDFMQFRWENKSPNNLLYFDEVVGNVYSTTSITYDATNHQWWRLRMSANTLYWDTSPDGIVWTNQRSKAVGAWDTSLVTVELWSGEAVAETSPGVAIFDNLNLPGGATPAISGLVESFTTQDAVKWLGWDAATTPPAVSGGQLQIPFGTGTYEQLQSSAQYDLTNAAVAAQLVTFPSGLIGTGNGQTGLYIFGTQDSGGYHFALIYVVCSPSDYPNYGSGALLVCEESANTSTTWRDTKIIPYDPVAHSYLRLRGDSSGVVYWETSPDGATWTTQQAKAVDGLDITKVVADLFCYNTNATSGNAIWDNVNYNPVLISPPGATLSLTGGTPILGTGLFPPGATLSLTGGTPILGTGLLPSGAILSLTGGTPIVFVTNPVLVQPTGGVLTLTGGTPIVRNRPLILTHGGRVVKIGGRVVILP